MRQRVHQTSSHPVARAVLAAGLTAVGLLATTRPAGAQPAFPRPSVCDGTAGNLVQNCGFETGDPSGWTVNVPAGGDVQIAALPTSAHSGHYVAQFSGLEASSVMERLPTMPGTAYTLSFYLVSLTPGGDPPESAFFHAFFGGEQVFALVGQGPNFDQGYARYQFTRVATGSTTDLQFVTRNVTAIYDLDDVSVTAADVAAVPEPATFALVAGGLLALTALPVRLGGSWRGRRRSG